MTAPSTPEDLRRALSNTTQRETCGCDVCLIIRSTPGLLTEIEALKAEIADLKFSYNVAHEQFAEDIIGFNKIERALKAENARMGKAASKALTWIELLCEAADIDPDETYVNARAVNRNDGSVRDLEQVSLTRSIGEIRAALSPATTEKPTEEAGS